jgi:hypothetical protein
MNTRWNIATRLLNTVLSRVIIKSVKYRPLLKHVAGCFVVHVTELAQQHHYKFKTQEILAAPHCSLLIGCW